MHIQAQKQRFNANIISAYYSSFWTENSNWQLSASWHDADILRYDVFGKSSFGEMNQLAPSLATSVNNPCLNSLH